MTILCVDDENLVLQLTLSLCREMPMHPEVTGFTSAVAALDWLKQHPADIALLDINMPDIDGITLAAKFKSIRPDVAIVFLTGHAQYAIDAFALHACGYILKPVSREKLTEEIRYAASLKSKSKSVTHIFVHTFGEFALFVDDKPVAFPRSKAKELLAYLVDRQGISVTRANAFAVIYEDKPYDRSMQKQMDVIIRSLRDTLEEYGIGDIFEMKRGGMRICPEKFECDLYQLINGDVNAINAYRGEYMNSYSWAALTEALIVPFPERQS